MLLAISATDSGDPLIPGVSVDNSEPVYSPVPSWLSSGVPTEASIPASSLAALGEESVATKYLFPERVVILPIRRVLDVVFVVVVGNVDG